MADAPPKSSSGLKKKVGPLPLYGWVLIVLAVAAYFLFFRKGTVGSSTAPETSASIPVQSSADQSAGLVPSAGAPSDSGSSTSDLLNAYGAETANLTGALLQTQANVVALAQAQQGSLFAGTAVPSNSTADGSLVGSQPGGANAPTFNFSFPGITNTATKPVAAAAKTTVSAASTAKKAATPIKYQTYKRDVVLKPGQTVHFTTGRGYYAA